jgi:hypothetical protein
MTVCNWRTIPPATKEHSPFSGRLFKGQGETPRIGLRSEAEVSKEMQITRKKITCALFEAGGRVWGPGEPPEKDPRKRFSRVLVCRGH